MSRLYSIATTRQSPLDDVTQHDFYGVSTPVRQTRLKVEGKRLRETIGLAYIILMQGLFSCVKIDQSCLE